MRGVASWGLALALKIPFVLLLYRLDGTPRAGLVPSAVAHGVVSAGLELGFAALFLRRAVARCLLRRVVARCSCGGTSRVFLRPASA